MKHPFFFSFFAFLIFGGVLFLQHKEEFTRTGVQDACTTLHLRGSVSVELATTTEAHEKGLSFHAPLATNEGMLFRFETPAERSFWMKDMLFPIDIIWLDGGLRVLSFHENVRPESFPTPYTSPMEMQYALEVPTGTVAARGLVPGDMAILDSNCPK